MITEKRFLKLTNYSEENPNNKKLKEFINNYRNTLEYVAPFKNQRRVE